MRWLQRAAWPGVIASVLVLSGFTQAPPQPSAAVVYDGGRLIIGDASTTIESGSFVVQNGKITAIGSKGSMSAPPGAAHVDLTGKTVIPAINNVHLHIGYEGYTSWSVRIIPLPTSSTIYSGKRSTALAL